ncbi:MAG: Asp-tRNA(Asn)/Glu-tRNA(Gln) amidotransferase subunit GatC [Coriobacteriia bacterium]|nr:Asp-tRNA(Asn)/Glu-tRNA(Gln) amidotransferase subunit GatC [Coriobacteriia bacterium]
MALSEAEVRHVAMLARLELTDEQVEALRTELNSILGHIGAIQQLDLSGVEPMTHAVPMVNAVREDAVSPGLSREEALLNAPDAEAGAFKIPRIAGVGEEGA